VSKRALTILTSAAGLLLCLLGLVVVLPMAGCDGQRTEEDPLQLCRRFADLRNAHDAGAEALLGPAVAVPKGPVTPEEAELIDADTFLRRDNLRIVDVRREPAGRFLLVMRGGAAGEPLDIRSGDRVNHSQRVMSNPALVVEVRDGKIHGLRAQLFLN
jgi:hypothetical protein